MGKLTDGFRRLFRSLFIINDSPQRIALGLGIGVFTGILPGMGPVAAMVVAAVSKANKAAAFAGSLLTNTWLSLVALATATRVGAFLFGIPWERIRQDWLALRADFSFRDLFSTAFQTIILPITAGYFVIGCAAGIVAYAGALIFLTVKNRRRF